jgi:hypothetical protein
MPQEQFDMPKLDEWILFLRIRVESTTTSTKPEKWDFTDLLDLNTGVGEQAWVEQATLMHSGTEEELDRE